MVIFMMLQSISAIVIDSQPETKDVKLARNLQGFNINSLYDRHFITSQTEGVNNGTRKTAMKISVDGNIKYIDRIDRRTQDQAKTSEILINTDNNTSLGPNVDTQNPASQDVVSVYDSNTDSSLTSDFQDSDTNNDNQSQDNLNYENQSDLNNSNSEFNVVNDESSSVQAEETEPQNYENLNESVLNQSTSTLQQEDSQTNGSQNYEYQPVYQSNVGAISEETNPSVQYYNDVNVK